MPVLLTIQKALHDLLNLGLEFREAFEAVEENGMDVGKGSDYSDWCMLLLVHDLEGQVYEKFRKHLEDELWLKVLCWICHYHWEGFFEAVEKSFFIITLSKINGEPVSNLLIIRGEVSRLFNKSLDGDIVKESLSFLDKAIPRNFRNTKSKAKLVLFIGQFSVKAE